MPDPTSPPLSINISSEEAIDLAEVSSGRNTNLSTMFIFILYCFALFFFFPWIFFTGNGSLSFINIFLVIIFFFLCERLYSFAIKKNHQYRPQKEYLSNINEYTDNDIVKAQEETAKNEWKKICTHCGTKIFAEKEFCPSCGTDLTSNKISLNKKEQKSFSTTGENASTTSHALSKHSSSSGWEICAHCGTKIFVEEIFCSNCGAKITPNNVLY